MKIRGAWRIQKALTQLDLRGIILMYHRVIDLDFDPRQLSVSPKNFADHIQVIKKYGRPVKIREIGKNLKRFSLGRKEIAITLDDGYVDNFLNARPILERHDTPASFFISTGTVRNRQEFWWNDLERAILAPPILPYVFEAEIAGTKYNWKIIKESPCRKINYSQTPLGVPKEDSTLSRAQVYSVLLRILSGIPTMARESSLRQIATWSGQSLTPRPDSLSMTAEQLVALTKSPLFEIGAHTVGHPMLTCLPAKEQEEEILSNKQDIENMINQPVTSFSYPHGDYSEEILKLVERSKFKNACTVDEKPVTRGINPLLLPRYMVLNWDGDEFERNLRRWIKGDV